MAPWPPGSAYVCFSVRTQQEKFYLSRGRLSGFLTQATDRTAPLAAATGTSHSLGAWDSPCQPVGRPRPPPPPCRLARVASAHLAGMKHGNMITTQGHTTPGNGMDGTDLDPTPTINIDMCGKWKFTKSVNGEQFKARRTGSGSLNWITQDSAYT